MFNFNENQKVLSFSHCDLDGIGCQIVLSNYFKNINFYSINYGKEDRLLNKIEAYNENYDLILITDFTPLSILNEFRMIKTPIIIIDHHDSALSALDIKNNIYINTTMSASKLVYKLFNKLKPMPYLNEFIEIINDFDLHLEQNKKSNYYNQLFWSNLYTKTEFINRFKFGDLKLTNEEKEILINNKKEINLEIENIEGCNLPRNGFMTNMPKFCTEVGDNLLKTYTWILFTNIKPEYNRFKISLRCKNDGNFDFNLICKAANIIDGGGHSSSAGASFNSIEELQTGIKNISKAMVEWKN